MQDIFNQTIKDAEGKLISIMLAHYDIIITALNKSIKDVWAEIKVLLQKSSQAEKDHHTTIYNKTKENINKLIETLKEKRKKKIQTLTHPD